MPRDWDAHYSNPESLDLSPAPLLIEVAAMLPPGRALDVACGAGRHALYLAQLGWRVTAVDRSPVAIEALRRRAAGLAVDAIVADLEDGYAIEREAFDLVCDFFYLQRDLFPALRDALKPGGVFVAAVKLATGEPRQFEVVSGELRDEFAGWKVLYYSEAAEPGHRPAARIIARKA